ncbi:MAG: WYL domain-containing protein [Bacilli bacterium]|nr:WYL domain-containing protein [Bacilli bacterium]
MSKISNILNMIQLLSSGRKYSIKELSDKLEVTPRQIRTYKEELELAGIYIDSIKGPYGGYILNQNINVPKRFITPRDIKGLDQYNYKEINRAIKEKKKCYIEYYARDKSISNRIIEPYDLILFGDLWGVAAYCELKQEIRNFYLNRIKSIKILDNK